jgi:hypothetical protein
MSMTHTRTYVILEISPSAFAEIEQKLRAAGYSHAFVASDRLTIDMHGIALQSEGAIALAAREQADSQTAALKKALQQAHLLLQTVAIRTAPQSLKELAQSCNMTTRNAAYLHPDVLKQFGLNATPGASLQNVLGSRCLIVCTPLLPAFGVIYGPLYDLFLSDEQKSEDFEQHWNVAKLHRAGAQPENLLHAGEKTEFVQKLGMNEYPYDRVIRCSYPVSAIYQLCEAQELFGDAVKVAQGGAKILWECLPENEIGWRDRFVEARCATWLTGRGGVEVGPRDPSL